MDPSYPPAMEPWNLERSPYTPEGEIEGAGKFAAGARRAGSRRQWVAVVVVAAVLLPFVLQVIQVVS